MGNHEFPCEVCGENKFGLSGCDETYHTKAELIAAKARREANHEDTTVIDEALSFIDGK